MYELEEYVVDQVVAGHKTIILPGEMVVSDIKIDQIIEPVLEEKETVYHEVTFYYSSAKDEYYFNCDDEDIAYIPKEYRAALNEGRLFKWEFNGGIDYFNPMEITNIKTRKQKGKKKSRWEYEDESLNPKRHF